MVYNVKLAQENTVLFPANIFSCTLGLKVNFMAAPTFGKTGAETCSTYVLLLGSQNKPVTSNCLV
jgi:hypothetical protein